MRPLTALFRRALTFFLCLLMVAPATLLDAAAQQPQQTGTTFTAESNLVLVPVIVSEHGQHLAGLTQNDFTISDDGKPQKIATFEEVKQVAPKVEHPTQPGMYTNAIDQPQTAHGMTIIMLDQINTPFLDQSYARQQLLKFLATHVSTNEPTSLVVMGRYGVRVVHDFTADPHLLTASLKKVVGGVDMVLSEQDTQAVLNGRDTMTSEVNALQSFYDGTDGGYGTFAITYQIESTLSALRHIAQGVEGIPGRKSLIWVTGAFPFEISSSGQLSTLMYCTTGQTHAEIGGLAGGVGAGGALPELPESAGTTGDEVFAAVRPYWERTMQAMAKANIAIYPIDARGLLAYNAASTQHVSQGDVCGTDAQRHTTMNDVAEVTGGKAFYNTNDVSGAFGKATDDSTQYYLVGYYAEKSDKAKWHKLKVSVARSGVDVRSRVGYMAGGIVNGKKAEDAPKSDIASAMASPLDYTGLPMRVFVDPAQAGAGGKKKIPFEIDVVPGIDKANKNKVSLEFVVIARNTKGEDAQRFGQKIDFNAKDDQLQQIADKGVNYNQSLTLPPGSYQVHFIVRDALGNRLGSVIAPVQVQ